MGTDGRCLVHRTLLATRKGDCNLYNNIEAHDKIVCMMRTISQLNVTHDMGADTYMSRREAH